MILAHLPSSNARQAPDMTDLFRETLNRNASDLHLTAHTPPVFRIKGELKAMDRAPYSPGDIESLVGGILTPRHREVLSRNKSVD